MRVIIPLWLFCVSVVGGDVSGLMRYGIDCGAGYTQLDGRVGGKRIVWVCG